METSPGVERTLPCQVHLSQVRARIRRRPGSYSMPFPGLVAMSGSCGSQMLGRGQRSRARMRKLLDVRMLPRRS
eukprot:765789-Hanusia_phi.AAC.1